MPTLHTKLALFKHFVEAVDKNSDAFKYPQNFFPNFLKKKDKSWYFCWPADKEDPGLQQSSRKTDNNRVGSFAPVVHGFLGNHKAENCVALVAKLVKTCSNRDCRMPLKVQMLDADPDQFMENMDAYSEEYGERFH